MIYQLFSVKDLATNQFMLPQYFKFPQEAVRSFRIAANTPDHPIHASPQDYELWHIGTYDEETAILHNMEPKREARAIELKE